MSIENDLLSRKWTTLFCYPLYYQQCGVNYSAGLPQQPEYRTFVCEGTVDESVCAPLR